jgi:hypothetical protein
MSALQPSATILVKLGSIAVHAEEMFSVKGHYFDKVALQTLLLDEEVQTWLKDMSKLALLPVKR